jgi:hypothetical protein
MKPVLTQRDSLLLSAPGVPRLALPQSRVGDAPNNLLHEAFAPCILQPKIVHKSRYPQCTAPSLPRSLTLLAPGWDSSA